MKKRRIAGVARIGVVVTLLVVLAGCIPGPITGGNGIGLASFDLSQVGYQRSEFFVGGNARTYSPAAPLTNDGKWNVTKDPATSAGIFKSRLIVYRPINPARFNGTVVVEWMNVTAGADLPTDWVMAHNELVRSGAVWVGVSVQAVGVNRAKADDPVRYASLVHPGDSFSYDIFTTAGRDIRQQYATVLGGLQPQRMIAAGESQSAGRLVTYINAVQPTEHAYDGFMVHSRSGGGSLLSQSPQPVVPVPSPLQIRDDIDVPVFVVEAETDVPGYYAARQPDSPTFRAWEIAGTSHADMYTVSVGGTDIFNGAGAVQMFEYMRNPPLLGCTNGVNAGSHHWILQAAFHHLDAWVRNGTAPPSGTPITVASTGPVVLARDPLGIVLGGVRSPQVDAPISTLTGSNDGPGFCRLFGSGTPFTPEQLLDLYPTHDDFVADWTASLITEIQGGFILPIDAYELYGAAVNSQIPN